VFSYIPTAILNDSDPGVHKSPNSIGTKYFRLGLRHWLPLGCPDTPVSLLRSLNTSYSQLLHWRHCSCLSSHPFTNSASGSTAIPLLSCRSSVNFTNFHTLWQQGRTTVAVPLWWSLSTGQTRQMCHLSPKFGLAVTVCIFIASNLCLIICYLDRIFVVSPVLPSKMLAKYLD
jgi:hypothetical protein